MYSKIFCAASQVGIDMPNTLFPRVTCIDPIHSGPMRFIDHAPALSLDSSGGCFPPTNLHGDNMHTQHSRPAKLPTNDPLSVAVAS